MRPVDSPRFARTLHPGAWWLWALGLAVAASRITNPLLNLVILGVAGFVVMARRSLSPWGNAYGAFLRLGLMIVGVRVILQALLSSQSQGIHVIVDLPSVPLPSWLAGLKLGGLITWEAVLVASYQGLQLATILCCIGAANSLANASRLLRAVPGALYEAGVSAVVALTFAPQLLSDAQRVRSAQRLRGYNAKGLRGFRRMAMPVLEGGLDRSVQLAAAMDSRGYGRATNTSARVRRLSAALLVVGLLAVAVGCYGILTSSAASWTGFPSLGLGGAACVTGLAAGGLGTMRTRYRASPWALPEWAVAGSGLAVAVGVFWVAAGASADVQAYDPMVLPAAPLLVVGVILLGAFPAILAPRPVDGQP